MPLPDFSSSTSAGTDTQVAQDQTSPSPNLPDFGSVSNSSVSSNLPDFSSSSQSPVSFLNRTGPKKSREEISQEVDAKSTKTEPEWLYKPLDLLNSVVQSAADLPKNLAVAAVNAPAVFHNTLVQPLIGGAKAPYVGNEPLMQVQPAPGYMESGVNPVFKGIVQAGSERATQLSTPENLGLLALAPESAFGMNAPLAKAFVAPMAQSVVEQYPQVKQTVQDKNSTPVEKATAVAGIGMDALVTGLAALGLGHNDIDKYTPDDLKQIAQDTTSPRVFNLPDTKFDTQEIAQKVADPQAPKLNTQEIQYLGNLAKTDPQAHQKYLEQVKQLRMQGQTEKSQAPTLPDFVSAPEKPLNPGGAPQDLSPELRAQSDANNNAMRAQYEELKAQAALPGKEENAPSTEASTSLSEPLPKPAPYADKAESLNAPEPKPNKQTFNQPLGDDRIAEVSGTEMLNVAKQMGKDLPHAPEGMWVVIGGKEFLFINKDLSPSRKVEVKAHELKHREIQDAIDNNDSRFDAVKQIVQHVLENPDADPNLHAFLKGLQEGYDTTHLAKELLADGHLDLDKAKQDLEDLKNGKHANQGGLLAIRSVVVKAMAEKNKKARLREGMQDVLDNSQNKNLYRAPEPIPGVKPETYEGGRAVTYTQDGRIRLVNIETDVEQRGKGYAGKFLQSLKERGLPIELDVAKPELKDFYKKQGFVQGERDSTMVWSPELEQKRAQKTLQVPPLRTPEENIQTYGEGRSFITETEKELNQEKPFGITPTKEGMIPTTSLLSKMERMTTKEERQGLDEQGFTEWVRSKGQSVKAKEVADWVKENGPKVEVRRFSNDYTPEEEALYETKAKIQHELDTKYPNWGDVSYTKRHAPEFEALRTKFDLAEKAINEMEDKGGNAKWASIAPKSEKDMKGYTEIAVVRPPKGSSRFNELSNKNKLTPDEIKEFQGLQKSINDKFSSSHSFPPNTLAWVRGHMEIDPVTKEKTFLIHEVQSDWAQRRRAYEETGNKAQGSPAPDPLLYHYESLALKAAIEHARQEGATHIAISDAETAMMTEGHDREGNLRRYNTDLEGNFWPEDKPIEADKVKLVTAPNQAPGMRQHYDVSLPNIAKKLIGSEGELKEYGEHKMAFDTDTSYNNHDLRLDETKQVPRKDLIFRNPDGTPKTSITARSYPLDKIAPRLESKEPMLQTGSKLFLTPDIFGLAKFVKQDLLPLAKRGVDVVKATKDILTSLISPTSKARVPDLDTLFESKGYVEKLMVKATHALTDVKNGFDKMSAQERIDFMDRVKRGQVQPTKELQQVAQLLRGIDDDIYNEVKKYKPSLPYLENHLRAIWEVIPGSKTQGLSGQNIGSKRPWQGSQGMFRQHTLVDVSEGLKAGGKLVTDNPAKLVLLNAQDSLKFIAANRAWEGLKKTGTVQYIKPGKRPPLDYVRINDSISKVYFPTKAGMVKGGEWYVQKDTAKLINNYLSRDYIRENELGKAAVDIKMATTAIELGLSPFHAIFESNETISSSLGLGMAKALSGRIGEGVKDVVKSAGSFVSTAKLGGMVKRFAQNEKEFAAQDPETYKWFTTQYPAAKSMIEDAFNAGMKITMHEDYQTNFRDGFKKAVQEGNSLGAAIRLIPALNEFPMQALFNNYIPKLKMGMFMREYAFELERRTGDLASGKVSKGQLGRQTWDFVEDRFGEMNFDNLYWNRTIKTSMQLLMRSITWRLGSARAYTKAFRDLGMETSVNWWKEGRAPRMTLPMGWLVGQALWTGVLSTMITKGATGKYPWELAQNEDDLEKNFTFPRIDEKDKNQRVSIPTYWRDFASIMHNPVDYVKSGLSGEIGRIADVWENKDFYGVQVRNPKDAIPKQVADSLKHLFPVPFGVANLQKAQTTQQGLAGFLGFPKAPSYVSKTPAEAQAYALLSKGHDVRTQEQFDMSTKEKQVVQDVRAGKTDLRDAMDKQNIPLNKYAELNAKATLTPLQYSIRHMGVDDAISVYDKGDVQEKKDLYDLIRTKIVRNPNLTFDKKEELFNRLDGKTLSVKTTPAQTPTNSSGLPQWN